MPYHLDRKSTRLNSSHVEISYAVFCLKKKKETTSGTGRRESWLYTAGETTSAAADPSHPLMSSTPQRATYPVIPFIRAFFFFKNRAPPTIPPFSPPRPLPV